ncbi:helix-turn-helix domain-containing protein [Metabacillus halosaccharovorans]|uniref:helix-turn-helix domain-containing protein n=1 Tax=Metabacillus halosaccharovorans TaxID=930124 RepID=UPI001C1FA5F5|nr:helix-turn-helix domain-containing protein [Metabacillus halosaccharovorans]MBU7591127.1 helix-turn-helix domain-containing protein [Metabacillus halosaccharovorans]
MNTDIESVYNLCNLISHTFDLPVLFITPDGNITYEINNQVLNPLYVNQKENFFNPINFDSSKAYDFPVIRKSPFSEKFILISVYHNHSFMGTVIIGPSISFPLTEDRVNSIINDARAFFYRDEVYKYYKSLPIIKTEKLIYISALLYNLFNQTILSSEEVKKKNSQLLEPKDKDTKVDLVVSENLQVNAFHDRLFEKKLLQIVKEGRIDQIKEISNIREEEVASIFSKSSYLRSIKNHVITLITLVSRASIDGGLHDEIALSLQDRYIQQVEELDRIDEVKLLAKEVIYTYTEKVQEVKNERYSKTVTACKDYIYKHLYDEISHDDLAKYVELSPKYLSVLFKKEVGISVTEYIQKTKIEEAKKLLKYSKTPISEIYSYLNFNDQSYFTKVFKKIVGLTPKLYRENHHLQTQSKDE